MNHFENARIMAKYYVSLRFQLSFFCCCYCVLYFQSCWQFSSKYKWIFAQWSKLLWVSWFVSLPPTPPPPMCWGGGMWRSRQGFFIPCRQPRLLLNAENSSNALRTVAPRSSWDSFPLSLAFSLAPPPFFFFPPDTLIGLNLKPLEFKTF